MNRLFGIRLKHIHSGMRRGRTEPPSLVFSLLPKTVEGPSLNGPGQWMGWWRGGFSGEPNLCTILPMALGQSRLVNYAVSCSICLCLAGKRQPVLVDMQQSRVSGLEGGSYCMWHVSVTFRRAPDLSQWWCSHVTKDGWASWGTFVPLCGREEWTWTECQRLSSLRFFIANTYESTAVCIYRVINGIVHPHSHKKSSFTQPHVFPNMYGLLSYVECKRW